MNAVIITILIYSAILTAVTLYKDNSGYFVAESIDVIFAGPVAWVIVLIVWVIDGPIRKYLKKHDIERKPREPKDYTRKQAEKIIKRIINIQKKYMEKNPKREVDCIDLSICENYGDDSSISGWRILERRKPRYERINSKFEHLMFYQSELGKEILRSYLHRMTVEDYQEKEYNEWWINSHKSHELYELK